VLLHVPHLLFNCIHRAQERHRTLFTRAWRFLRNAPKQIPEAACTGAQTPLRSTQLGRSATTHAHMSLLLAHHQLGNAHGILRYSRFLICSGTLFTTVSNSSSSASNASARLWTRQRRLATRILPLVLNSTQVSRHRHSQPAPFFSVTKLPYSLSTRHHKMAPQWQLPVAGLPPIS
jgi:hypothetical protein